MIRPAPFVFKIASEPWELEQIRRLNYRTFVDEIPQHAPNEIGLLVDRFESQSTFIICLRGPSILGMICVRAARPFSLDQKIPDLDAHLPPSRSVCELRLLAVHPKHRSGVVFRGLVRCLSKHCIEAGHDLAVISGTDRQLRLYRHLGFVPFGPMIGTPGAKFQPMYITLEAFHERVQLTIEPREHPLVSFQPGPVELGDRVKEAMRQPLISHRSSTFANIWAGTRRKLLALTGAGNVQLLLGSGTLANDVVAGQLSLLNGRGLVVTNGEFGERLAEQARRWNLSFDVLSFEWGEQIDETRISEALACENGISWLWAVHCETSTGRMNDVDVLRAVCERRGVRLALDCISSIGVLPVNLRGVHLATGVSGKALGAPAGIGLVFHEEEVTPAATLPKYVDLGVYASSDVTAFTYSSLLVRALHAAIEQPLIARHACAMVSADAAELRAQMRADGFSIIGDDARTSPAVTTIALPPHLRSENVGERLETAGFAISYRSGYLIARNWIQVCLMGYYRRDQLPKLVTALCNAANENASANRYEPARNSA